MTGWKLCEAVCSPFITVWLETKEADLSLLEAKGGQTDKCIDGQMDGQTNLCTDSLCILTTIISFWGPCLKMPPESFTKPSIGLTKPQKGPVFFWRSSR